MIDASVHINNQLTRQNRHLLWVAKEKAKQGGWSYVYESAGKLLARKNESNQAILISTVNDVGKITRI